MAGPLLLGIPLYMWATGAGVSILGWEYYKPGGGRDQILDAYGKNHAVAMNEQAGEEREKALASSDNAQACATCEPPPECRKLNSEIQKFRDKLAKRYEDMRADQHNLFINFHLKSQAHPKLGSWEGHQEQFRV